jgi:FlgD Ig-like domain
MISLSFPSRPRAWLGALVALLAAFAVMPARAGVLVEDALDDAAAADASAARWEALAVSSAKSRITGEARTMTVELAAGDRASFSRSAAMSPAPNAILCTFNVGVSGIGGERTTQQVFRMGWDFGNANGDEPDARTYAALGLVASEGDGFQLRDLVNGRVGATYHGTQAVSWVVNHSGSAMTYDAPNGKTERVGRERMDVWVGRDRVFDDILVTNANGRIADLKWVWSRGSGTTRFDHFEIRTLDEAAMASAAGSASVATLAGGPPPSDGSIALERPTPNPFSAAMRFAYAIPGAATPVDIGVFDVAGRRVRGLAHGPHGAGQYEVRWDGLGDDGKRVKQGVYFLRASIGASSRVSRIVYLPN